MNCIIDPVAQETVGVLSAQALLASVRTGEHSTLHAWLAFVTLAAAHGWRSPATRAFVIELPSRPGTLAFFRGRYSLHRVTPIEGTRPRLNSVLTYASEPGHRLNPLTAKLFYGRDPGAS